MEHGNQAGGGWPIGPEPADDTAARAESAAGDAAPFAAEPAPAPAGDPSVRRGLLLWLVALLALGLGGLAFGMQELAALIAFAGVAIAAQAADVDPRWFAPYVVVGAVVPIGGAAMFAFLANLIWTGDLTPAMRSAGGSVAILAAAISLFSIHPAVARGLVHGLFRTTADSHALRLAARVVVMGILSAFPASLVVPQLLEPMLNQPGGLFESGPLGGELVGYIVLALASIGFLVRRDLRQSLDRLGLRTLGFRDLAYIAAGVGVLFLLNIGADWLQNHYFHKSWEADHRVNEELVRGLTTPLAVLLGATAGIGEEITLRGALQPRLGIPLTATLFAALHVQYSWFGMVAVLLLGVVLGVLRQRSCTTTAMAVHAIYDVMAVFTT